MLSSLLNQGCLNPPDALGIHYNHQSLQNSHLPQACCINFRQLTDACVSKQLQAPN